MSSRILPFVSCALVACALSPAVSAQSIMFHAEGDQGQREIYFADPIVLSRTPPTEALGPSAIMQLDITIVHEGANAPEWSMMRYWFECPSMLSSAQMERKGKRPTPIAPTRIRIRLAEGSTYLDRSDLTLRNRPAGAWEETSSPAMLTARQIACNDVEVSRAIRAAFNGTRFDQAGFNERLKPLGFSGYLGVVPVGTASELTDLVWSMIWKDSKKPDPGGRWSQPVTAENRATAMEKMGRITNQVDALAADLGARYRDDISRMDSQFKFDARAAKLRGTRKLNNAEVSLIQVWQGKTEAEVIAALGPAALTETGELRILSYGRLSDNRVVVQNMQSGAAWEEGIYMNCNVDYVLMPDNNASLLVADVRVSVDSNDWVSSREACTGILETPR